MESFQSNEILGTIVPTGIPPCIPFRYEAIFIIFDENRLIDVYIDCPILLISPSVSTSLTTTLY
jgi:hypothetical protein